MKTLEICACSLTVSECVAGSVNSQDVHLPVLVRYAALTVSAVLK